MLVFVVVLRVVIFVVVIIIVIVVLMSLTANYKVSLAVTLWSIPSMKHNQLKVF